MPPIQSALLSLLPFLAATATAQLRVDEILVDPIGPNAGNQLIEIQSHGSATDLDGYQLVTGGNVLALPPVLLPAQSVVLLHLGASGTNTATDFYFPNAAPLSTSDSIALFRGTPITSGTNLIDFVSFGGGQTTLTLALQMLLWAGPQATVPVPTAEGVTMARIHTPGFPQWTPKQWYADQTSTLGAPNDYASFDAIGGLCAGANGPTPAPRFGGVGQGLPWIDSSWDVGMQLLPSTPSTVTLFLGTETPLTMFQPAPLTFCFTSVAPFAVQTVNLAPNSDVFQIPIPNVPGLVGLQLAMQGVVSGYATAFPFGLTETRRIVLGLR